MNKISENWKPLMRNGKMWTLKTPLFSMEVMINDDETWSIWNAKFLFDRLGQIIYPTLEDAQIAAQEETLKILDECIECIQPKNL